MSPKAAGQTAKSVQMVAPKQSPAKVNGASKMHRRSRSGMQLRLLPSRQSTKVGIKDVIPVASEGRSVMKAKICAKLVGT